MSLPNILSSFARGRARLAAWALMGGGILIANAPHAWALTATPACTEGPYYTFSSANYVVQSSSSYYDSHFYTTEGTDNDLTHIYATSSQSTGSIFLLSGTLVNTAGVAVSGATIEMWEADNNGIYSYVSSSSGTNNYAGRDKLFQGYGKATTDSTGAWSFRCIKPGKYVGRIKHFHLKINAGGTNILTTQFMFNEDSASFSSDNVAQPLVQAGTMSLVTLTPTTGTDTNGNTVLIASKQLVINYTVTGSVPSITSQPASVSVVAGNSASFTVVASSASALTYQWYKGAVGSGTAISGATAATYTIGSVASADAGTYYAKVTNTTGSTTSSAVTLSVTEAYAVFLSTYGLNATTGAPSADPDGDGVPNGLEFLLGGSPVVADAGILPTSTYQVVNGATALVFAFNLAVPVGGTTWTVEYSPDMAAWTTAVQGVNGVTMEVGSTGTTTAAGRTVYPVKVTIPTTAQTFARLRVVPAQ